MITEIITMKIRNGERTADAGDCMPITNRATVP